MLIYCICTQYLVGAPFALKGSYYAVLQSLDFVLGVYYNMLSCLVVRKSHYFSHNLHYYNTFLPSLTQTARLVLGLMKARLPKNEMCCDWLAVPVRCDWRTA